MTNSKSVRNNPWTKDVENKFWICPGGSKNKRIPNGLHYFARLGWLEMPFHEKSTPLANYPNPIFQFSERVVSFSFLVVNTNTAVESPVLYCMFYESQSYPSFLCLSLPSNTLVCIDCFTFCCGMLYLVGVIKRSRASLCYRCRFSIASLDFWRTFIVVLIE